MCQGRDRGLLSRSVQTVVDVALEPPETLDKNPVPGHEADPHPRHVEGLRKGIHFYSHVTGALDLENTRGSESVVGEFTIGVVVDKPDVVVPAKGNGFLKGILAGGDTQGVVRIVQDHKPRLPGHIPGNLRKIGEEPLFFLKGQMPGSTVNHGRHIVIYRVPGIRENAEVSLLHRHQREMGESFLGAPEGEHLLRGIEGNAETLAIPTGDRRRERGIDERILIRGIFFGRFQRRLQNGPFRTAVRAAHAQVDDLLARRPGFRNPSLQKAENAFIPFTHPIGHIWHCVYSSFSKLAVAHLARNTSGNSSCFFRVALLRPMGKRARLPVFCVTGAGFLDKARNARYKCTNLPGTGRSGRSYWMDIRVRNIPCMTASGFFFTSAGPPSADRR